MRAIRQLGHLLSALMLLLCSTLAVIAGPVVFQNASADFAVGTGVAESSLSGALAGGSAATTCATAAKLATHGVDTASAGAIALWTGEQPQTLGGTILASAGLTPEQAELVYGFIGAGIEMGALRAMLNAPSTITPQALQTYVANNPPVATNSRPSHLTSHPNAHTIERHGPQVTDQQLETRALTGVAPDGSTLAGNRIPPLSSAFHSEGAMLRADAVMRGQPLQDAIAANPTATGHTITFDVGENVGRGYRRIGSGNPNNVGRNGPPERVDGLTHAQARVELNQATGEWETITMFPTLP